MKQLRTDRRFVERGGHGVTKQLTSMHSSNDVFWSARGNSYVAVQHDNDGVKIFSINGIGEIRWSVEEWNRDEESKQARQYFIEGAGE